MQPSFIDNINCMVKWDSKLASSTIFYDRRREIEIPDCMVKGSLAQAQALRTTDHLRRSLLGERVFDVKTHVAQLENGEITRSLPTYDRIVHEY